MYDTILPQLTEDACFVRSVLCDTRPGLACLFLNQFADVLDFFTHSLVSLKSAGLGWDGMGWDGAG